MKIKNIVIILSFFLNIVLGVLMYLESSTKESPVEVGISFKEAVRVENYALAKTLIVDGRKEFITEKTLMKVNEIMSSNSSFRTYELIEFSNGEMVLLNLIPEKNYKIQDVIIVPEQLKHFLDEKEDKNLE